MTNSATAASAVMQYDAATPTQAAAHFATKLCYETDCSDVHQALLQVAAGQARRDFVLLDVRSAEAYQALHVPGAVSVPHRMIDAAVLASFGADLCFVVYCAGPHCNGADQAAWKIASRGYPVKLMIGGITGWADEGLPFAGDASEPQHLASALSAVRCDCA